MVRLYLADIRQLPDPAAEASALAGLPEQRQKKCLWYLRPDDRKRCLGAGHILARILQDAGGETALTFGPNGKPEAEGCHLNVSHGGSYVLGVWADCPVGCDVEEMTSPPMETAAHYFHGQERTYLAAHRDPSFAFWQLWTLKESYMKMTGEGMQLPLDAFYVTAGQPIMVHRGGVLQDCALWHTVRDGHSMALCLDGKTGEVAPVSWHIYDGREWRTQL